MAKYKVIAKFKDKVQDKVFEIGEAFEATVKRADEINKNTVKGWGVTVLERVLEESPKSEKKDETPSATPAEDKAE